MSEFTDNFPSALRDQINAEYLAGKLDHLIFAVLSASASIAHSLRCADFSSNEVGTSNLFGDAQLDADVKADLVMFNHLKESKLVAVASSEENPVEVLCGGNGFSVAFDPLDGSSIIDANFAVGTIVGIWPGSGLLNRMGREQVCSLVVQYGPRVTAAIALSGAATVSGAPFAIEITLHTSEWKISKAPLIIAPQGKVFAPGNLRATSDNPAYKALVDYWIENKYTLRYSGGLVPDVYHILIKGKGVLSNASSKSAKAKLRLLFECAPIALIVEAAGGASCVCASEAAESIDPVSLLDVPITHLDRRVGVCYGSVEEVERFKTYLFPAATLEESNSKASI